MSLKTNPIAAWILFLPWLTGCSLIAGLGTNYETVPDAPKAIGDTNAADSESYGPEASLVDSGSSSEPDSAPTSKDSGTDSATIPDSAPSEDTAPACGDNGQQCCGGDAGVGGTCATTGGTIGTGWLCSSNGQCGACGVPNNYCCPGNLCQTSHGPSTADCATSGDLNGFCM